MIGTLFTVAMFIIERAISIGIIILLKEELAPKSG